MSMLMSARVVNAGTMPAAAVPSSSFAIPNAVPSSSFAIPKNMVTRTPTVVSTAMPVTMTAPAGVSTATSAPAVYMTAPAGIATASAAPAGIATASSTATYPIMGASALLPVGKPAYSIAAPMQAMTAPAAGSTSYRAAAPYPAAPTMAAPAMAAAAMAASVAGTSTALTRTTTAPAPMVLTKTATAPTVQTLLGTTSGTLKLPPAGAATARKVSAAYPIPAGVSSAVAPGATVAVAAPAAPVPAPAPAPAPGLLARPLQL
mmetsp:Transcript_50037/g.92419  ORF Transcript_50037/g.92419 Transcript_50037/m.92419 type:complete len:261 (+) Transcript_50037:73-855(+)